MNNYFKGYYFKHQKGEETLSIIVGQASGQSFIQIVTKNFSYSVPYTKDNKFSKNGIILNIKTNEVSLTGKIAYENLTPIKYHIMGPLKFIPTECSHNIISLHHNLKGSVKLNGKTINFTGGTGYIEMDMGTSFPQSYSWVQCNDFSKKCSIVAAVATLPFSVINIRGCFAVVYFNEREYRLASYLGAKIIYCTENKMILQQGKYRLEIRIIPSKGNILNAPKNGAMSRNVYENTACPANFKFYIGNKLVLNKSSQNASFEFETQY